VRPVELVEQEEIRKTLPSKDLLRLSGEQARPPPPLRAVIADLLVNKRVGKKTRRFFVSASRLLSGCIRRLEETGPPNPGGNDRRKISGGEERRGS